MRFVLFFLIVALLVSAGFAFVGRRLTVGLDKESVERRRWRRGLVALLLLTIGSIMGRGLLSAGSLRNLLAWIGFTGLGFFSLLLTFVVIRDLCWLAIWLVAKAQARFGSTDPKPVDPERRRALLRSLNFGKLAGSGLLLGYGLYEARTLPAVRSIEVPIKGLTPALDGFRIVQLTDLHVGPTIRGGYVAEVVELANGLKPDLVAITGDLVDGSVDALRDHVAPLKALRSTHGSYFVTGNHEYYSGVLSWVEHLTSLGMSVLINSHQLVEHEGGKLLVGGVTDIRAGGRVAGHETDPRRAIAGAPASDLKLMLAHQPRSVFGAAAAGFDLQLSGHTHGGQFVPWNWVVHLLQPYVAGLHRHDSMWIYVSRGTGYWGPPLRIGAPSEITLIRLRRA